MRRLTVELRHALQGSRATQGISAQMSSLEAEIAAGPAAVDEALLTPLMEAYDRRIVELERSNASLVASAADVERKMRDIVAENERLYEDLRRSAEEGRAGSGAMGGAGISLISSNGGGGGGGGGGMTGSIRVARDTVLGEGEVIALADRLALAAQENDVLVEQLKETDEELARVWTKTHYLFIYSLFIAVYFIYIYIDDSSSQTKWRNGEKN